MAYMKWFNEGNTHFQNEEYDLAIKCWEKALELGNQEKMVIAKSLINIGIAYSMKEDWNKAMEYFHQSLVVERELGDDEAIAECLMNIGDAFLALKKWESARIYYKQSLELYLEIDRNKAKMLLNIGVANFNEGNWTDAIEYYQQSLEVFKELEDLEGISGVLTNLGIASRNLGDWEKAVQFYKQSLEIDQKLGDKLGSATSLMNIGIALEVLGRVKEAIEHYQQSLIIFKEVKDEYGVASCLLNLGNAFEMLKKWDKAQEFYEQSLKIFETLGDKSNISKCLTNIGIALRNLGKWEEAVKNYQKSLGWFKKVDDQAAISKCLLDIGVAYYSQGKWDEAAKYYEKSRELFQKLGDRPGEALACQNLGWGYQEQGDQQQALKYLTEALGIYTTLVTRIITDEYRESYAKEFEDLPKIIDNITYVLEGSLEMKEYAIVEQTEKETDAMNDLLAQLQNNITELNTAVQSQGGYQNISKNISGLMNLVNKTLVTFSTSEKLKSEKISRMIFDAIEICDLFFKLFEISKIGEASSLMLEKFDEIHSRLKNSFPELDIISNIEDRTEHLREEGEKLSEAHAFDIKFEIISWIRRLFGIVTANRKIYQESLSEKDDAISQKLEEKLSEISNSLIEDEKNLSEQILGYIIILKKKSGIPIHHMNFIEATFDSDLVGGFLSAIQSFGSEISKEKTSMEKLAYKDFQINFQDGKYIRCALILKGEMTELLSKRLKTFVNAFETTFDEVLSKDTGFISVFESSDSLIQSHFDFSS